MYIYIYLDVYSCFWKYIVSMSRVDEAQSMYLNNESFRNIDMLPTLGRRGLHVTPKTTIISSEGLLVSE